MKRNKTVYILIFTLLVSLSGISCQREFNNNEDFTADNPVEVFGDNTLLYSKIFRFLSSGAYLWFDIRNEIASFSSPFLGIPFNENGIERNRRVDLRGRLYRYNRESDELTILAYPLDIAGKEGIPVDIVFTFKRKQEEGCELIADPAQRNECERTFVLSLKSLLFKDPDLTLDVGVQAEYNGRSLLLSGLSQEIYLTN
ncbi:hypothetical protein [Proteiniphilum sp.]|uniref:hypothetical protein n=1 Tax=Proteiniphilum sp. TaxID=1926877 RepID=UPI002B1F0B73|nr:hypothetical protein [Proteiniphilum sp.]MEA4917390.1 hypothetical protein [Proteiniphilum sp.]